MSLKNLNWAWRASPKNPLQKLILLLLADLADDDEGLTGPVSMEDIAEFCRCKLAEAETAVRGLQTGRFMSVDGADGYKILRGPQ